MSERRVLVAYASKHGATEEIAERIGVTLRAAGLAVDVDRAGEIDAVARYDAVVLGSAVYVGRWRGEASRFLKQHRDALAERPTWLFSSGPTGDGEPVEATSGWTFPASLKPLLESIAPRDVALFHGKLDPDELGFFERWIVRRVGAPEGDFRDLEAIDAWARSIAEALGPAAAG